MPSLRLCCTCRAIRPACFVAGAVAAALALAAVASAGARQNGTLVVQLVTDPSPPGVSWTYSGAGASFELGMGASVRTVSLPAGTYQLREAPAQSGQAKTLTALVCRDPGGDTTASVATASAAIALADGETVTCTFTHRALGPRPSAAGLALARRYAPVLRLSAAESYRPLRIEDYLSTTTLHGGSPPRGLLVQAHPTLFSLPTTPGASYLDIGGAQPGSNPSAYSQIEQRLRDAHPRATVYWHIARQPSSGRLAIEYWLLYLYNDFYDRHEADWEGVTVILQGSTPLGVSYSAHQGRRWSAWSSQTAVGTHPVIYVARGSHANYPRAGRYSVGVCWTSRYGRTCTSAPRVDTATGTGPSLTPSAFDLHEFGGAPFTGNWGSGNYILGVGLTRDQVTDPRHRSDYSNPFGILSR
jgi:hypothetical protein